MARNEQERDEWVQQQKRQMEGGGFSWFDDSLDSWAIAVFGDGMSMIISGTGRHCQTRSWGILSSEEACYFLDLGKESG